MTNTTATYLCKSGHLHCNIVAILARADEPDTEWTRRAVIEEMGKQAIKLFGCAVNIAARPDFSEAIYYPMKYSELES